MKYATSLASNMPVALAVVTQNGETVDSNRTLIELAERCQVRPSLTDLFGAAFARVLSRAWIERHIQSTAPVIVGPEPRGTYRLSFMSTTDEKTLGVVLQEVTAELECRRALSDRDRDFAVLLEVSTALSGLLEFPSLAERVYDATRRAIPSKNIYIAVHDRETNEVSFPRYLEDGDWKQMTSRPFGSGLTEHLLLTGKPLLLNENVLEQAQALGIEPHGRPCLAWVGAPLIVDGEAIGVIAVQDYEAAGRYSQHDVEMLTIIAAQAASGIKNARAIEAERRAYRELAAAQSRMLETERLRGVTETVGALNHEINNPLAAIAGNCQLVLKRPDGLPVATLQRVEAIREAAQRIQRTTAKMSSLIQACSMPYPGRQTILDVRNSIAGEAAETAPQTDGEADTAAA